MTRETDELRKDAAMASLQIKPRRVYRRLPLKTYRGYKNQHWMFGAGTKALKAMGTEQAVKRQISRCLQSLTTVPATLPR
jgi:hypothetical protein